MARYIDLDKVEFLKVEGNKEFNHGVDCCINSLLKMKPADVIEREKVDKAIEKIKQEINSDFWNSSFCDGMKIAMKILARNIGE